MCNGTRQNFFDTWVTTPSFVEFLHQASMHVQMGLSGRTFTSCIALEAVQM